jgi:hypothetical protein
MLIMDIQMEHVVIIFYFIKIQSLLVDQVNHQKKKAYFYKIFYFFLSILAYAIACASLAIIASSLSIILLWLAGGYLYVRSRRRLPNFVTIIALLTFLICK